jgi:hypothetical protein
VATSLTVYQTTNITGGLMESRKGFSGARNGATKFILASLFLLVLGALAWASSDPWKAKPYQQWDATDIKRIFADSPWCKTVQIDATWKGAGSKYEMSDDGGMALKTGQGSAGAGDAPSGKAIFVVRWVSARTIREAGVRNSVLEGQMNPEDAEKELAKVPDVYQIFVGGRDLTPFAAADDKTLQASAFLIAKKTKQKIAPVKAQILHGQDGKMTGVVFVFPKKTDSGEPTVGTDEKSVDFTCTISKARILTTFEIPKMEDSQGRDL